MNTVPEAIITGAYSEDTGDVVEFWGRVNPKFIDGSTGPRQLIKFAYFQGPNKLIFVNLVPNAVVNTTYTKN